MLKQMPVYTVVSRTGGSSLLLSQLATYRTSISFAVKSVGFSTGVSWRSEPDFERARQWYKEVQGSPVPREIGDVSYSRSSGPGGQNVNKVNSKAQLRVTMDELLPHLPDVLHDGIKASRYYTEKSTSLLIQCDESRKQAANKDACYRRLSKLILDVYNTTVPGETSKEQKEKVRGLQKAENEARIRLKKHISNKKASRRGGDE